MGSLIELGATTVSVAKPRRAAWGLVTELDQQRPQKPARRRQGVVYVDDLAIVCVVAEIPIVGDRIHHTDIPAVVEKVRVTREGQVRIYAQPAPIPPRPAGGSPAARHGRQDGP
jgi:hypothetical protein